VPFASLEPYRGPAVAVTRLPLAAGEITLWQLPAGEIRGAGR